MDTRQSSVRDDRRLELLEERDGRLYVVGGWPNAIRMTFAFVGRWLRPGSVDLVDIRVANGRGIYRVELEAVGRSPRGSRTFDAYLVYFELEGIR